MDAAAPGLRVAQAIGRIGDHFNQELVGGPTDLPWALRIDPAHRPPGYAGYATFDPSRKPRTCGAFVSLVVVLGVIGRRGAAP